MWKERIVRRRRKKKVVSGDGEEGERGMKRKWCRKKRRGEIDKKELEKE